MSNTRHKKIMNRQSLWIWLPALLLLMIHSAQAQESVSARPLTHKERAALFPGSDEIGEGRAIAQKHCASCHGLEGISKDLDQPHLAGQRTIYLYRELQYYQAGARADDSMRQAVGYLGDNVLLKAAIYYASLPPPRGTGVTDEAWLTEDDPLRGIRSATAGCGSCHGPNGNSVIPGMPSLTAQHPDYFIESMKAYQAGARNHNMMQMLVATLNEESIADMGLFYALQTPEIASGPASGNAEAGRVASEACAGCHGPTGNATAPDMPSIAGQDATYLVQSLKSYMNGQRDHEPMKNAMTGIGNETIADMAAFYAAQQPVARPVRKPLTTAEWLNRCSRCHGEEGNSSDPRYASLAGQNEDYLKRVLKAYANGERQDSIMHAMSRPLTYLDVERIAAYYAARDASAVIYFELPCEESGN
jgi:cytochrome c553